VRRRRYEVTRGPWARRTCAPIGTRHLNLRADETLLAPLFVDIVGVTGSIPAAPTIRAPEIQGRIGYARPPATAFSSGVARSDLKDPIVEYTKAVRFQPGLTAIHADFDEHGSSPSSIPGGTKILAAQAGDPNADGLPVSLGPSVASPAL